MAELTPQIVVKQQTPPLHHYHEVKWRLLAEAPWLGITLVLAMVMSSMILLSKGQFAPNTIPHIVTLGLIVVPTIIILASGDVDLSVGMLVQAVCQIVGLHWWVGLEVALITSLGVALVVGLINGLLVGFVRLKGIYVTLGMSYILLGLIYITKTLLIAPVPPTLSVLAQSPFSLSLWILLVLACAALMIFTPLGRRSRAGEPEPVPLSRKVPLYKGLPFLFSSLMAWISGVLLQSWAGYAGIGATYTGIALLAALLGGTAYYAGTGFILSGTMALIAIVLFRQILGLSSAQEMVVLGALLSIMLPIAQYYHARIDRLYFQWNKKAKDTSSEDDL